MTPETIAGPCLAHFGGIDVLLDKTFSALEADKKAVCDCCGLVCKMSDGDMWDGVRICPDCGRDLREVEG